MTSLKGSICYTEEELTTFHDIAALGSDFKSHLIRLLIAEVLYWRRKAYQNEHCG